jgi:FAD/FMN-containing dehydrogenase
MNQEITNPLISGKALPDPKTSTPGLQDWARFVSIQPQLYLRPQDTDELKRFLVASLQGIFRTRSLRVLGGLHSCSAICVSDGIIDTSDLPRTIEFGPDNSTVIVSTNWHLHDFLLALSERGKSIACTGGTDHQTLAGLISTTTAPATPQVGLYDLLDWVEYITVDEASGAVIENHIERGDPAFLAMVGSLGTVGILTRVQFRLIDEPFFETIQKVIPLKEVLTDIEQTSQTYDFWRIDWIPDTDKGLLWAAKRVQAANAMGDYPLDRASDVLTAVFGILSKVAAAGPLLDEAMRLLYGILMLTYGQVKVSGPLRTMLPVDRRAPLRVAMAEWSFNPADLHRVMDCCRTYFEQNGWPNLPIEIELTKTDAYYMSAWNWPGLDYIVKFNFMYMTDICETAEEKAHIVSHLHGLWNFLLQSGFEFKAHWGKINFMDYNFVREHFQLDRFQPFIRPLFLNQYLAERIMP